MNSSVFALKSQMIPLTVIELSSSDDQAFCQQLEQKVQASPALFDRMPAILGLDELEPVDESTVQKFLFAVRKFNILPIALRGSEALKELAQKLDLAWIPPGRKKLQQQAQQAKEVLTDQEHNQTTSEENGNTEQETLTSETIASETISSEATSIETPTEQLELSEGNSNEVQASSYEDSSNGSATDSNHSSEEPVPEAPVAANSITKVVSTPVRSGQQIYAKGGDLVILSQVGQGAEVIADGNIHIYGTLRGRAIAGASGNQEARIFCQSLQAELISIAGIYKVSDDLSDAEIGQTSRIELRENHLHIEPL